MKTQPVDWRGLTVPLESAVTSGGETCPRRMAASWASLHPIHTIKELICTDVGKVAELAGRDTRPQARLWLGALHLARP